MSVCYFLTYLRAPFVCMFSLVGRTFLVCACMGVQCDCFRLYIFSVGACAAICRKVRLLSLPVFKKALCDAPVPPFCKVTSTDDVINIKLNHRLF
jgi:hypothetical protein